MEHQWKLQFLILPAITMSVIPMGIVTRTVRDNAELLAELKTALPGAGHVVSAQELREADAVTDWVKGMVETHGPLSGVFHGAGIELIKPARMTRQADLDIQEDEGVDFQRAWGDPESGMVWCISEAPSAEAVQRIHERAGHPADNVYEVPVQA